MEKLIDLKFEGNFALIELTNGLNEICPAFLDAFDETLDKVLQNEKAEALITFAKGRHFSNGISIETVKEGTTAFLRFMKKFVDLIVRIMTFPLPTYAAVNGHAFAGGFFLAMAHDYRLMNEKHGYLCFSEVRIHQMFPVTLMEFLKCKIPCGNAQRDLILMGKRISGTEAVQLNIVDAVVPLETLLEKCKEFAKKSLLLGAYERQVLQDMKTHLYNSVLQTMDPIGLNFIPPYVVKSAL